MITSTAVKKLSIASAGAVLVLSGIMGKAQPSTAAVVTFKSDTFGARSNTVSNNSPLVGFSDSMGNDLFVEDYSSQSSSKRRGVFPFFLNLFSLIFGKNNPDHSSRDNSLIFRKNNPDQSGPDNIAKLDILNNDTLLNTVSVPLNRNDLADQIIAFSGASFNEPAFTYNNSSGTSSDGLEEVVDNVTFTPHANSEPVPEPLTILGSGLVLGFGSLMKRQQSRKLKKTSVAE